MILLVVLVGVAIFVGVKDAAKDKIRADFSTFSLAASRVMFDGGDPYDKAQVQHNYKYFPANAILLYPFTRINVYAAQGIWFAINCGLLFWAFIAMRDLLRPIKVPWWVYALTLTVTFRLIMMNLRLGQWNTSVFCLSIIGLREILGGRKWGSVLLSLAITLKFMPGIFLFYLAARRRWKFLWLTVAATVFWIALLPIIVFGPARTVILMKQYYADSVARVDHMTTGQEVSSVSLHSTIYRALSPVQLELKGIVYRANVFNLSNNRAGFLAALLSMVLLIAGGIWLWKQGHLGNGVNQLGELLLIGLCYLFWFITAPGVRHAQLISVIPITFAIAAAIKVIPAGRTRRCIQISFLVIFVLFNLPAEIVNNSRYNLMLEASGIMALALVLEAALGIWVYRKIGLGPLKLKRPKRLASLQGNPPISSQTPA